MSMRLARLRTVDGSLPFDRSAKGFNRAWWYDGPALQGREYFSVVRGNTEVARAEVDPNSTDVGSYVGLTVPGVVVKIEFFEVRRRFRGDGIGRDAVAAIAAQYEGAWLTVVSSDAGGFWEAIGWTEARYGDRPDVPSFRYLLDARTGSAS
ncbi:hypothetical protein [Microbacterium jiangjiandongii]|uniref:hypothetical protein n=1 Tax=Microbacterium jiangjiandongii TaxID=3049071 RepID=UPI00214BF84A|nr:hypothetical protein [Microbacterium sp. zg.Y843]MCR2817085.1 hypothetical protein [Microbacterium sp. zg.Y843]